MREYNISDKPKLIEILHLNVPEYFEKSEVEDFYAYLDKEVEKYFIAELDEEIIGSGGINFEDGYKVGKISWDLINPKFQRIGLGSKLLIHRIELLKSMNSIEVIFVRTSQLAYKFYEKNGFLLKEIHKDYWAEGFDMYKMIYEEN
ncbi:MAG TPA: GNAT family N-acetyltransferase [Pelobium sp.]|nr:GNAT family N-acetyltransferase [Pelobium sp.]